MHDEEKSRPEGIYKVQSSLSGERQGSKGLAEITRTKTKQTYFDNVPFTHAYITHLSASLLPRHLKTQAPGLLKLEPNPS